MAKHKSKSPRRGQSSRSTGGKTADMWIWGLHSVSAALDNPDRVHQRLLASAKSADALKEAAGRAGINLEVVDIRAIEQITGREAVHQGMALLADPLPGVPLDEVMADGKTLMVLDQVTDPHNVGAILRSCAAFGVGGLILQDRHAPPMTGVLTKAASGAVEHVPLVRVTNLSRALDEIRQAGYWRVGLDGEAAEHLGQTALPRPTALVMGAEGAGMRRLTRDQCDFMVRIPMAPGTESLNVSAAAAIALYAAFSHVK